MLRGEPILEGHGHLGLQDEPEGATATLVRHKRLQALRPFFTELASKPSTEVASGPLPAMA